MDFREMKATFLINAKNKNHLMINNDSGESSLIVINHYENV